MTDFYGCLAYALAHHLEHAFYHFLKVYHANLVTKESGLDALAYAIATDCYYNQAIVHLFEPKLDSLNTSIVRHISLLSN